MCSHTTVECGNLKACVKCGLLTDKQGRFLGFDKDLPNYKNKRKGAKK